MKKKRAVDTQSRVRAVLYATNTSACLIFLLRESQSYLLSLVKPVSSSFGSTSICLTCFRNRTLHSCLQSVYPILSFSFASFVPVYCVRESFEYQSVRPERRVPLLCYLWGFSLSLRFFRRGLFFPKQALMTEKHHAYVFQSPTS